MPGFLKWISICLLNLGLVMVQTSTTQNSKPKSSSTTKPGTHATANLPSEATVDAFLQQQFGYQPGLTWKIQSIKPSQIEGLAEVNVVLASDQGQQLSRFYVAPDGEHALVGDVIPFGPRPFDPVKKILEKGVTGPSRGPKDSSVMIVEFGDLQ